MNIEKQELEFSAELPHHEFSGIKVKIERCGENDVMRVEVAGDSIYFTAGELDGLRELFGKYDQAKACFRMNE